MYEETQTLNLTGSDGLFTLSLDDGTGTRTDSSGIGFSSINNILLCESTNAHKITLQTPIPASLTTDYSLVLPTTKANIPFMFSPVPPTTGMLPPLKEIKSKTHARIRAAQI